MASTEFLDPYLDPETGVLFNRVGARTRAELDEVEGDLTFARLLQLEERPVPATGDLAELQAIHQRLFQDVYVWAGELRTVDIRKNVAGAGYFLPVSMIERAAGFASGELAGENMLRGLGRDRFVERLAYHYDQFNYVHPFREGNGRTQRVFWNRIAADAGWQLDWRGVQGAVNDAACRAASDRQDLAPLQAMFEQVVTAAPVGERDEEWQVAERARLSFPTGPTQVVQQEPGISPAEPRSVSRKTVQADRGEGR